MSQVVYIPVRGPSCRGAPQPAFNVKSFNERRIFDAERAKECQVYFDTDTKVGHVEWLTQESEKPSPDFFKEVKRVFKAIGVGSGTKIEIIYGIRDGGWKKAKTYTRTLR